MSTFVLVHGLGGGSWNWKGVRQNLIALGHEVFTPTLTGVGERSHLASRDVNLDTHICDVSNLLKWENLDEVILVGHSYGGAVVTGAADKEATRIKKLVYLDAFILPDGKSVMDLQPPHRVEYYNDKVKNEGDGWLLYPNTAEFYGIKDAEDQKLIDESSTPHPFATFTQPVKLQFGDKPPFPRAFIWASNFTPSPFTALAEKVRNDPDWEFHEIPAGHMLMFSHTEELSRLLHDMTTNRA
jgi:pimeloyl-ACP methyl ester carboxylesterase